MKNTRPRPAASRSRGRATARKAAVSPARRAGKAADGRVRAGQAKRVALSRRRFNADPEEVERSLAKLVLSLVEFLRQLMERQAVRRMEEGTLSPPQVESMGIALMQLEETLHELAARFGLKPSDLNLDLGPLGRLT